MSAKSFDMRQGRFRLRAVLDGVVAQLVEHHNGIVGVRGSSPLGSTILRSERSGERRMVSSVASAKEDWWETGSELRMAGQS